MQRREPAWAAERQQAAASMTTFAPDFVHSLIFQILVSFICKVYGRPWKADPHQYGLRLASERPPQHGLPICLHAEC